MSCSATLVCPERPYNCTTRLLPALAFQKPSQNLQANPPALRTPCSLGTYSQGLIELRTRPHSIFPQKPCSLRRCPKFCFLESGAMMLLRFSNVRGGCFPSAFKPSPPPAGPSSLALEMKPSVSATESPSLA